jgi:TIR domain
MSSLADLPELVGFFSYSRGDDEYAGGALSRLRARILNELRLQLGRDVRLWQDTSAIPHGALWGDEIKQAIAESAFFIPIVTPSAVASSHCRTEFELFQAREVELRRKDLIFPVLYIKVPALGIDDQRRQNDVLETIHARQYADWTKIRQRDIASFEVGQQIETYCQDIVGALQKPCETLQERRRNKVAQRGEDHPQKRNEEAERVAGVPPGLETILVKLVYPMLESKRWFGRYVETLAKAASVSEEMMLMFCRSRGDVDLFMDGERWVATLKSGTIKPTPES